MLDEVGLIHMNGRVYDPELGRFVQADPFVQDPTSAESLNRYAYLMNNPLNGTDPSGYFGIKDAISIVVAAVITVACWGTCGPVAFAALQGLNGFIHGYAITGTFKGALIGGLSAAAFAWTGAQAGIDGWALEYVVGAIGLIGGITAELQGGNFGHGFLSAGVGALVGFGIPIGPDASYWRVAGKILTSVVAAGTTSELAGGKFANGAISAAFATAVSYAAQSAVERPRQPNKTAYGVQLANRRGRGLLIPRNTHLRNWPDQSRTRAVPINPQRPYEAPLPGQTSPEDVNAILRNLPAGLVSQVDAEIQWAIGEMAAGRWDGLDVRVQPYIEEMGSRGPGGVVFVVGAGAKPLVSPPGKNEWVSGVVELLDPNIARNPIGPPISLRATPSYIYCPDPINGPCF